MKLQRAATSSLFIVAAVAGLAIGFVLAWIGGLAQPLWWGGEALITPMMGLLGAALVAAPMIAIPRTSSMNEGGKKAPILAGVMWGAAFPFAVALFGRLIQVTPGWDHIPPALSIVLGYFLISALLAVVVALATRAAFRQAP